VIGPKAKSSIASPKAPRRESIPSSVLITRCDSAEVDDCEESPPQNIKKTKYQILLKGESPKSTQVSGSS